VLARNDAAIARIGAMQPVNADEADLAAHCIAARDQAADALRLTRVHADDIALCMKLNAQFMRMERTAMALRNQLLRVQAVRHKREALGAAATDADAWTAYIATRQMQLAVGAAAAGGEAALATAPSAEPVPATALEPASSAMTPEHAWNAAAFPAAAAPAAPPTPAAAAATAPPCPAAPASAASPSPASMPAPLVLPPPYRPPPWPQPATPDAGAARSRRPRRVTESEDAPRDLAAEADYYANVYPYRARPIRHHGGLPPNCDFGPPDDDLVRAIVTGTSAALRALDDPVKAVG
jgi:hypothetical protein